MSNDGELRCVEHGETSDEFGRISSYLSDVQDMLADRERWVAFMDEMSALTGDIYRGDDYGPQRVVSQFMWRHSTCTLEIYDEYGSQYPTTKAEDPTPKDWTVQLEGLVRDIKHIERLRCISDEDYIARVLHLKSEGVEDLRLHDIRYLLGRKHDRG